jgi:SAM-dependent methyltransferase
VTGAADDKRPLDLSEKDVYSSRTPNLSALVEYEILNQDYRMKNVDKWKPSKAIQDGDGNWVVNLKGVGRGSKHVASLQIPAYAKIISKYAKGSLLDCGAGKVPFYGVYKELVSDITCTDWGSSPHDLKHIDKEVDLSKELPFKDSSIDTILLTDVLEHLSNPQLLLSESERILRTNGRILIFVPFLYWLHEQPHDYFRYTEHALTHLIESSGLISVEIYPYGGGSDVLIDMGNIIFRDHKFLLATHKIWWKLLKITGSLRKLKRRKCKSSLLVT